MLLLYCLILIDFIGFACCGYGYAGEVLVGYDMDMVDVLLVFVFFV